MPCQSPTSAIEARLVNPSVGAIVLILVPLVMLADRPFEIELATSSPLPDTMEATPVAHFLSTHARLLLCVGTREYALN